MTPLPIKLIHPSAQLPTRGNPGDAGLDLYAVGFMAPNCLAENDDYPEVWELEPQGRVVVHTGLKIAIPEGYAGIIWPRSGLAAGSGLDRMAGLIDNPYRGELLVLLVNHGSSPIWLKQGDKIAQLLILPVPEFEPVQVEELSETVRGAGGFGSTGR